MGAQFMMRCLFLLFLAILLDGAMTPVWGGELPPPPLAAYVFDRNTRQAAELRHASYSPDRCGRKDSALDLDHIDYAVAVVENSTLHGQSLQDFTVSAWVNPRTMHGYQVIVEKFDKQTNQRAFRLALKEGRLRFWWSSTGLVEDAAAFDAMESEGMLPRGAWSHVAATFAGGQLQFYINGQPDSGLGSGVMTISMGEAPIGIGGNPSTSALHFDGRIDDVMVWDKWLDSNEISALQAGGCK